MRDAPVLQGDIQQQDRKNYDEKPAWSSIVRCMLILEGSLNCLCTRSAKREANRNKAIIKQNKTTSSTVSSSISSSSSGSSSGSSINNNSNNIRKERKDQEIKKEQKGRRKELKKGK